MLVVLKLLALSKMKDIFYGNLYFGVHLAHSTAHLGSSKRAEFAKYNISGSSLELGNVHFAYLIARNISSK